MSAHVLTVWIPSNRTNKDGSPKAMDGLNEIINHSRTNRHKAARVERENVEWCAWHIKRAMRQQGWTPMLSRAGAQPCHVAVTFVESNRRRDVSNIVGGGLKYLLDALSRPRGGKCGAGAIYDDSVAWLQGCLPQVRVDKESPGIYVMVTKCDQEGDADD